MSENGNIQLSSQNDYISLSSMVVSESFPRADCCIPLCQRLRWLAFVRTSYNNNLRQRLRWLAFVRTSITGDYHPPETPIVYHRVRKCKFSKCRIAYYPNATATRRILLLSGDIEVNPGVMVWRNLTLLMSLKTSDQSVPLHLSTQIFPCAFLREDTPPIRIWTNTNHQHEYQSSVYLSLSPLVRHCLCVYLTRVPSETSQRPFSIILLLYYSSAKLT